MQNITLFVRLFKSLPRIVFAMMPAPTKPVPEEQKYRDEAFLSTVSERLKTVWIEIKKSSWRNLSEFVTSLPSFQPCFPAVGAEYNEYFLEELCATLRSANLQVKPTISDAICALLRVNHKAAKRAAVFAKLMLYSQSESCYDRVSFLVFSVSAAGCYSRSYLRKAKLVACLTQLGGDRAVGVRMRFIDTALKVLLSLGEDSRGELLSQLKELQQDKDREVRRLANFASWSYIF